jgi:hypothetical protein
MLSETTRLQRYLSTEFISKRRLILPAVWLKPEGLVPSPDDAIADSLSTDLDAWTDQNLGVRLVDGHIELKIAAPDDIWADCLFKAFRILQVDARAAYGVYRVSSIILRVDDPKTIDRWVDCWPVGHTDKEGKKVKTQIIYSAAETSRSKAIWRVSSPLPGSILAGETVVWRPQGKAPAIDPDLGVEDLEARPLAATNMESICRAIAYATLLYWIRISLDGLEDWDGSLTRIVGGWLAKIIPEGQAINAHGKSLEGKCWCPIEDHDEAVQLLRFLQEYAYAPNQLGVEFRHAEGQLERNPSAHVPGWSSLENALGVQAKVGIRRAFHAGIDIALIEMLAERYVLDETSHRYLDRETLIQDLKFDHGFDELVHVWQKHQYIDKKGKAQNPFRIYAASALRTDVKHQDFHPSHEPGALLRLSPGKGILPSDSERESDEYLTLNIFPGFKIKPIATIDPVMMSTAITMLDRSLGLLTQNNDAQMKWLKQFIAHIAQKPAEKPQVCPVVIGGQGIGKSVFGETLMEALFGKMAGTGDAASLSDNKFLITPFVGKLITFIDEVKLEPAAVNIIKKLVRQKKISGQVKFSHQRDYYIPSRILIASNQVEIGLSPADASDRAFFFIMSVTAKRLRMLDNEFLNWTLSLKPFYTEFISLLEDNLIFRQHLMRYFMDFEVTRAELESLEHSSRTDEEVVRSMTSKARDVAREIVAEARVRVDKDITAWFTRAHVRQAILRIDGRFSKVEADKVIQEFESAGVLDRARRDMYKFKYGYGKILKVMGGAHNMEIVPQFDPRPGVDWEDNEVNSPVGGASWRGDDSKEQRDFSDPRNYRDTSYNPDDDVE